MSNKTQISRLRLFSGKNPNENTISSQFAANQQVFTNELINANVVRQPFYSYSLDLKLNFGRFSDHRHPYQLMLTTNYANDRPKPRYEIERLLTGTEFWHLRLWATEGASHWCGGNCINYGSLCMISLIYKKYIYIHNTTVLIPRRLR